jgi:hypothetical protein
MGKPLDMDTNIKLGSTSLAITNVVAYNTTVLITTVKSFKEHVPSFTDIFLVIFSSFSSSLHKFLNLLMSALSCWMAKI